MIEIIRVVEKVFPLKVYLELSSACTQKYFGPKQLQMSSR